MNSNSIELDDREMWKHCFTSTIFIVEANSGLTAQLGHAKSFPCIIRLKLVPIISDINNCPMQK